MKRREILRYTAYFTGYAVTAPLTSAILSGCKAEPAAPGYAPVFWSEEAFKNVSALVDVMLPATQTPGAKELGVPQFVDLVLQTYTEDKNQQKIRTGLTTWTGEMASQQGKPYHELDPGEQLRLLNELDAAARAQDEKLAGPELSADEKEALAPWWLLLKDLVIGGYFSTQKMGTEVLAYDPVPGVYEGCIPLAPGQANWSL
ncbi:MAG: hypothetical protein DA408_01740 [Bacteroidetes bacterium]|nr:MAG: hypothetical protein C7N36_13690 [Bacteroidota bacterium]PTM14763.1 MAG: hypothetical protein DA408_01740 [Bacteroidota bacterium]